MSTEPIDAGRLERMREDAEAALEDNFADRELVACPSHVLALLAELDALRWRCERAEKARDEALAGLTLCAAVHSYPTGAFWKNLPDTEVRGWINRAKTLGVTPPAGLAPDTPTPAPPSPAGDVIAPNPSES